MKTYIVKFEFIENGCKCKTAWVCKSFTATAAEATAREWFGFEKDGIEVVSVKVEELD